MRRICSGALVLLAALAARADDRPSGGGEAPVVWEERLRAPDWHVRWIAARALGKVGVSFERTVPDLVEALGDSEPMVGAVAAEALGSLGANGAPGVARLVALAEERPAERVRFLRGLGVVGASDPDAAIAALSPVFRAAKGSDPAEDAIVELAANAPAPAVAFLTESLTDKDWRIQWRAVIALRKIGPPARTAVPALVHALDTSRDPMVPEGAAAALGRIGDASEAVLAALERGLSSKLNNVRNNSMDALVALGEPGFPTLSKSMASPYPETRGRLLGVLPNYPAHGADVLPAYLAALRDDDPGVRYNATLAITAFDGVEEQALPRLREALNEKLAGLRAPAAAAVLRFVPDDADASNALLDILRGRDENTASRAAWAITFLVTRHRAASLPFLRKALSDRDPRLRTGVVGLLDYASFGDPALAASLLPLLRDADPDARTATLSVLARCAELDSAAVAAVRPLLRDAERKVRIAAARMLGRGGPASRAAIEDLQQSAESEDAGLRVAATIALARLDPAHAASLAPTLVAAMRARPSTDVAELLARLGPAAAPAVDALLDALKGSDSEDARKLYRDAIESALATR